MSSHVLCGLDEVGRGALAGPLVAAAVILPLPHSQEFQNDLENQANAPIRDSKKLTHLQRQRLFQTLTQSSAQITIASISVREINTHGIGWANKQVFINLIQEVINRHSKLSGTPDDSESIPIISGSVSGITGIHFIVDGNLNIPSINSSAVSFPIGSNQPLSRLDPGIGNPGIDDQQPSHTNYTITCLPRADAIYPVVSLASIVAKVTRDQLMQELHPQHPHYSWNTNVGYGTKAHINSLRQHGPTPHHRTQFVETVLNKS